MKSISRSLMYDGHLTKMVMPLTYLARVMMANLRVKSNG